MTRSTLVFVVLSGLVSCCSSRTVTETISKQAVPPRATATRSVKHVLPTKSCRGGISVSNATSCPFAFAVVAGYAHTAAGARRTTIVRATSPVTGASYSMACAPMGRLIGCKGGNGALVRFPPSTATPHAAPAAAPAATAAPPRSPPGFYPHCAYGSRPAQRVSSAEAREYEKSGGPQYAPGTELEPARCLLANGEAEDEAEEADEEHAAEEGGQRLPPNGARSLPGKHCHAEVGPPSQGGAPIMRECE
jgi:hypothetical protein